jgi:hypothetical protein
MFMVTGKELPPVGERVAWRMAWRMAWRLRRPAWRRRASRFIDWEFAELARTFKASSGFGHGAPAAWPKSCSLGEIDGSVDDTL